MKPMAMAIALALATAVHASAQPPASPPTPMIQVQGLKTLTPHVQAIPDNSVSLVPNIGFVVGTKGVLVVDTGLGSRNGAAVAAVAQRLAKGNPIYLVTTHAHPEHDLGAQAFPASTKFIRSKDQVADAEAQGMQLARVFAQRSPAIAELLSDAKQRPADITFDREYKLDLGGVTAILTALGPNHTAGDTATWVPEDRVLFSGDVAMRAQPAMMAQKTSIDHWLASLDRLEALKPAVVVPSHGPIGDVALIQGYRRYIQEVRERTRAAKASGLALEAATAKVAEAMRDRYPDAGRLAGAVRVAFAE